VNADQLAREIDRVRELLRRYRQQQALDPVNAARATDAQDRLRLAWVQVRLIATDFSPIITADSPDFGQAIGDYYADRNH
jgi:hypothetical protein